VLANISYLGEESAGVVILVSDGCSKMYFLAKFYEDSLPKGWSVKHIILEKVDDSHKNYKESAQLLIAKMRTASAVYAKQICSKLYWSLDSDVIPKVNSLRCMIDLLDFDHGYYGVTACPYPSQGGGPFMLGHGTPQRQILPNFYNEEKEVPEKVLKRLEELTNTLKAMEADSENLEKSLSKRKTIFNKIRRWETFIDKKCQPSGNVYDVTSKFGWKRRGWLDFAYPSLGKGAIIPSDWCGFGNTLCSERALALIDFSGYEGKGTEDLFIIWNKWHPNGIRIGGLPHCPADHVIRRDGGFVHILTYHEQGGEFNGHLRQRDIAWRDEDS
jgi:hypothetical protein